MRGAAVWEVVTSCGSWDIDVSEKYIASVFRPEELAKKETSVKEAAVCLLGIIGMFSRLDGVKTSL